MLRALIATITAALLLTACGPSDAELAAEAAASEAAAASAAAEASTSAEAEAEAKQKALDEAEWRACVDGTADLYEALRQIDSRLDIGLNYSELGDRIGDAKVAYDDTDFDDIDGKCTLNVGIALEDALNQYGRSLDKWRACIDDYNCSVEGAVLRKIRKHWSEASERLEYVEKTLTDADGYAELENWPPDA